MRVSGLATGMDTENIIKNLMDAERIPLDKITNKKQQLEWKLEDYRDVNRDLRKMQYNLRDTVNRQSSFIAKNVTVSNPDAVGIKSVSATADFSGTIAVHQLATNATMQSAKLTSNMPGKELTADSKLSELGVSGKASMTITAPGSEGVTLTFEEGATIKEVLQQINEKTGVNAFFDKHSGKIALSANNSGEGNISVTAAVTTEEVDYTGHADLATALGLTGDGTASAGQSAKFTFNGLTTERDSNTFQINGFEINLKQVTAPENDANAGKVTFSSSTDVDKVLDTVVKFVDDYNTLIEDLNAKIRESTFRDFHPLSAEQKKEMSEKEIELWEEKAKSGALKNDPAISSMLTKLRNIMNSEVNGSRLSDFGITATKDYLSHGKLEINEDKLREKIAEDPERLYNLIGNSKEDGKSKVGLSHQFRMEIEATQKVISKRAGSAGAVNDSFALGRNLKEMDKQIERFESRLLQVEDRYWRQFGAMESAIQRMNAQSAQLMSQFGGM